MQATLKEKQKATTKEIRPFGMRDKIGYMLGDTGNNMFFGFVGGYLMLFYTDIVGISAASVGTLLVIARIWDAINDPMIGTLIDSRPARSTGKFRPYLLYFSFPVIISGILSFTTIGSFGNTGKLLYAYVTYILFGMMYTCINIPYGSLASVMTSDPVERTSLSTWRSIGGMVANFIIMGVAPIVIFNDASKPTQSGFFIAAIIFGIIGLICYKGAHSLTTERIVHPAAKKEKINLVKTMKGLSKNRGLIGIMVASLAQLTAMILTQSITPYLYKDYFHAPKLIGIAGAIGMGISFMVLPMMGPLVKKFGKKELGAGGLILSSIVYSLTFILPITNPFVFMTMNAIGTLGMAFMNVLVWAIVADAIDYQEYITGERKEGIVYASYSLVRKLGQAAAGGLAGFSLTFIGYVSSSPEQTAEVALGIKKIATFAPAAASIVACISMYFICNLSKKRLEKLNVDLEEMRKNRE
ncbi:glycoside-pentoside-hexuronide (GPH):cation symporter [uncultured Clostridium sp.]|uniref:MFS transporter n=1 Tax=uncultured Clostridium sp. TaxID=59620 RepID=UPI002613F704|nr:glycoside-pentoside-hexuronide (GPH):cation symporter [uncultured Clostridium sp.]